MMKKGTNVLIVYSFCSFYRRYNNTRAFLFIALTHFVTTNCLQNSQISKSEPLPNCYPGGTRHKTVSGIGREHVAKIQPPDLYPLIYATWFWAVSIWMSIGRFLKIWPKRIGMNESLYQRKFGAYPQQLFQACFR